MMSERVKKRMSLGEKEKAGPVLNNRQSCTETCGNIIN